MKKIKLVETQWSLVEYIALALSKKKYIKKEIT